MTSVNLEENIASFGDITKTKYAEQPSVVTDIQAGLALWYFIMEKSLYIMTISA